MSEKRWKIKIKWRCIEINEKFETLEKGAGTVITDCVVCSLFSDLKCLEKSGY